MNQKPKWSLANSTHIVESVSLETQFFLAIFVCMSVCQYHDNIFLCQLATG